MHELVPLSTLDQDQRNDLGQDTYSPIGATAYGAGGEHIGKVVDAYAEQDGRLRYLDVEVGNWFTSKQVLVPVGLARFGDDDHAVHFDSLTREQVQALGNSSPDQDYGYDQQAADERVLRGTGSAAGAPASQPAVSDSVPAATDSASERKYSYRDDDQLFQTPQKLQLLEERLQVNKEKYRAGSVEVGKRVETRQENIGVDLQREEVVIERTPVTEARPVEGNVTLGQGSETVRVDLEAERANVQKQAFVTEEVSIGKRSETEHQTVTDTVGKEVLDVTKTGDVDVSGSDDPTKRP